MPFWASPSLTLAPSLLPPLPRRHLASSTSHSASTNTPPPLGRASAIHRRERRHSGQPEHATRGSPRLPAIAARPSPPGPSGLAAIPRKPERPHPRSVPASAGPRRCHPTSPPRPWPRRSAASIAHGARRLLSPLRQLGPRQSLTPPPQGPPTPPSVELAQPRPDPTRGWPDLPSPPPPASSLDPRDIVAGLLLAGDPTGLLHLRREGLVPIHPIPPTKRPAPPGPSRPRSTGSIFREVKNLLS